MKSIIRNIIILIVVLGLGYVGYMYFFKKGGSTGSTGALETTTTEGLVKDGTVATNATAAAADASSVGQDFVTLLLNIQSIKLDDSLFTSKQFTLLQDFNRPIPPDTNPGRPNPFANLGIDGAAVSTQVSTSNPSSITTITTTLNGTLAIGGPGITRWFEYGPTNALGTVTTSNQQANPGAFSENITGLQPNTTYYVKAAASIGGVIVAGNLVTWKTAEGGTQQTTPVSGKQSGSKPKVPANKPPTP